MSKKITKGIVVSPGIKIGKAYVLENNKIIIPKYRIKESEIEKELERLDKALEKTRKEIEDIQKQIARGLSNEMADIFTSHLMVLDDPLISDRAKERIRKEKKNSEWIINDISLNLINSMAEIEDEYLRERIIDISDINKRIILNLQKKEEKSIIDINDEVIVFASDITPSETAIMNKNFILAFVTDRGGKTSHTAIMARALEIPAIVGTINATTIVKTGDTVILDAVHGEIIINPTEKEIKEFHAYQKDFKELEIELAKLSSLPSKTLDNQEISIYGNIEIPEEMKIIKEHGAQGIGLFRSEFLFLDKSLPDEEKQFMEYKKVAEFFNPLPVTIRTIDVGGDKVYAYNKPSKERNPFLGCRAIRFSLENQELFEIQIRAILRASNYGNVKLMFPMISTLEEFLKAKEITYKAMGKLKKENIPFNENIEIGIMIEVPSAVIIADLLAKHADFFSIGTNDLVQYTLAVDRISEKIAYLYNPLNIAVLRFLKTIISVSQEYNVPVSICGEIAGEPQYTMLLLGLGFKDLSMSPTYMHQVKKIIRSITMQEAIEFSESVLKMDSTKNIEKIVRSTFKEKFTDTLI